MARLCGGIPSTIGIALYKKSCAHKVKTRLVLALVAGTALALGLTVLLLKAPLNFRYRTFHLSARNDGYVGPLIARRDTFNELPGNILNDSSGNTSLLVGGITAVQSRDSALRGLLTASNSSLPPTGVDLRGANRSLVGFQRAVTDDEKAIFVDLMRVIDDVTARHNVTYFMTYGTMLGSFRHHDMTPWDDDVDVAMPYKKKAIVWKMLNGLLGFGYVVNQTTGKQFRFVGPRSRLHSPSWKWRWPYVDIDLYSENETHVFFDKYRAGKILHYDKKMVFPVHRRPLGPVSLNSPRDGLTYLKLTYGNYTSCSTGSQHRNGRSRARVTIPCSVLNETYPFVHRFLTWDRKVMETLKLGSKVLYSITVDEPIESVSINPFTLKGVGK